MNETSGLALVLFLAMCAALLLLPFYAAWSEWLHPTDRQPLRLAAGDDSQASLVRLLRQQLSQLVGSGHTVPLASLEQALVQSPVLGAADQPQTPPTSGAHIPLPLTLAPGCCFQQIDAPQIVFGVASARSARSRGAQLEPLPKHLPLNGAQPWGQGGWRINGDCSLLEGQHFIGSLVVTGVLTVGNGARLDGDVKARRGVVIGEQAQVNGSVFSDQGVRVLDGAFIGGPLVAETLAQIGAGVQLGRLDAPTSVSANVVLIGDNTTVHGSVRATQIGLAWGTE